MLWLSQTCKFLFTQHLAQSLIFLHSNHKFRKVFWKCAITCSKLVSSTLTWVNGCDKLGITADNSMRLRSEKNSYLWSWRFKRTKKRTKMQRLVEIGKKLIKNSNKFARHFVKVSTSMWRMKQSELKRSRNRSLLISRFPKSKRLIIQNCWKRKLAS